MGDPTPLPDEKPKPPGTLATALESAKDGCSYSLELTKQFLTLASAAIAFILGLASAESTRPPFMVILGVLLAMTLSILLGLTCHARVTGLIAKQNKYDAYDPVYIKLATLQLGCFALGFLILAVFTVQSAWQSGHKPQSPDGLEIRYHETVVRLPITNGVVIYLKVTTNSIEGLNVH